MKRKQTLGGWETLSKIPTEVDGKPKKLDLCLGNRQAGCPTASFFSHNHDALGFSRTRCVTETLSEPRGRARKGPSSLSSGLRSDEMVQSDALIMGVLTRFSHFPAQWNASWNSMSGLGTSGTRTSSPLCGGARSGALARTPPPEATIFAVKVPPQSQFARGKISITVVAANI
ncbi:hypothetical protein C8J57DRAFT_1459534 [Mycena rebaudengoi]|nr:hypothetical protein C8J57DRAFT_1459534 [Mycena rebaudengoi]